MMRPAWIVGEVLVDLLPAHEGDERIGDQRYRAIVGGGPANTARALAKLGAACEFIGGLSSDRFGHMAWMELERDGVGLDLVDESDLPTAKAIVSLGSDGSASYRFEVEGSATFSFDGGWLPDGVPEVVHVGTLAVVVEPGRSALLSWAREKKRSGALVVFDPNVRPSFLGDRERYRGLVEDFVEISDVVKASEEDLQWLYPELDQEAAFARWLGMGVEVVVLTRGARGMVGLRSDESLGVAGVEVEVVDTVGAGDTVGAVLVEALLNSGLESLRGDKLRAVLERAASAAAITCSREGAVPPSGAELAEFIKIK
jgi:fructokinase